MKNKQELNKLANQIIQLEQNIQKNSLDKNVQFYIQKIENIMESLSIKQLFELNEIVEKNIK